MANKIKKRRSSQTTPPRSTTALTNDQIEVENQQPTDSKTPTTISEANSDNNTTNDTSQNQQLQQQQQQGQIVEATTTNEKKTKLVRFASVHVYEFERCQGFGSIPGNYAPLNQTITLGMQYKHTWQESFASVEDYLRRKRRDDLDKLELFVRQYEQLDNTIMVAAAAAAATTTITNNDDGSEPIDMFDEDDEETQQMLLLEEQQRERVEQARLILANRDQFETDLNMELNIDPEILCPILTNEERIEKLACVLGIDPSHTNNSSASIADIESTCEKNDHTNSKLPAAAAAVTVTPSSSCVSTSSSVYLDHFDKTECEEVNDILKSRETCGCECQARNQSCNTATCSCFSNGIQCQIDRCGPPYNYPCRCTPRRCKNPHGIRKFDWTRVERHWKQVIARTPSSSSSSSLSSISSSASSSSSTAITRSSNKNMSSNELLSVDMASISVTSLPKPGLSDDNKDASVTGDDDAIVEPSAPTVRKPIKRKKRRTLASYSPHKRKKQST